MLLEAVEDVAGAEDELGFVTVLNRFVDFFPRHRGRDEGYRTPAQGVGRHHRLAGVVLAPIHEDLAGPQAESHAVDDAIGPLAGEGGGPGPRERRRLLVAG